MVEVKKTVKNRTKGNKTTKATVKKSAILGDSKPTVNSGITENKTTNSEQKVETVEKAEKVETAIESAATVDNKVEEKKSETKVETKEENNSKHHGKIMRYFTEFWNGISMSD